MNVICECGVVRVVLGGIMGEGGEASVGEGGVSVGGEAMLGESFGLCVVEPFLLCSDGEWCEAGGGGGCVWVWGLV